ncbi:MAG: hypothetical protein Q9168_006982 [Polycauliona sp. 1 TL-2023]
MSSYQQDFLGRYPQRGLPDREKPYRQARDDRYPGVGGGFPGPQYFDDGYDAAAAHDGIDHMKAPGKHARDAYGRRLNRAENFVRGMEAEEARYYHAASGDITARDHHDLAPLARGYADSEFRHASARESIYSRGPMMYGTAHGQREHHQYISEHYGEADYAENQYGRHSRYAMDPTSRNRDLYKRPVPAGYQPSNDGYPGALPTDGYYSAKYDRRPPPSYGVTDGRMSQKERRRLRLGQ